jgi:hypothetical protein
MFDEVRIPFTTESNIEKACSSLETILKGFDHIHIQRAKKAFQTAIRVFKRSVKEPHGAYSR